ncbi:MAG: STT3 domain-containing protein [Candidatus Omnitrophica bacterium]|nr:STT3 domain-containing protein [Candidatus Omnitrophota bacterium]
MIKLTKKHFSLISLYIIIATLAFGIYFRIYPITKIPRYKSQRVTDLAIKLKLKQQLPLISQSIDLEYPYLSKEKKEELLNLRFQKLITEGKDIIETKAAELTQENESLFRPYLLGSDSYYYYYLTKEILKNGRYSPQFQKGKYLDPLMTAPLGFWRHIETHPFIGAFFYKTAKLFSKNISLFSAISFVPIFVYSITAILFIYLCFQLRIGFTSTLIASLIFSLSPIFIQRSAFGWYDTDPYNVLFPILTLVLITNLSQKRKPYLSISLLAWATSLYTIFWEGWIILPISVMFFFLSSLILDIKNKKTCHQSLQALILYPLIFVFISMILLTPLGLIDSISDFFKLAFNFNFQKIPLWPDTFLTVGELKKPSALKLISILGWIVPGIISLYGFLLCFLKKTTLNDKKNETIIGLYFLLTLILAKNVERFSLFLLVPYSITFAIGLNHILVTLVSLTTRYKKTVSLTTNSLAYLILIPSLIYANTSALHQSVIFNQVWLNTLTKIKEKTQKNSIVNTWWCPGHFIKAIAERKVTFDGATLNTPQAYWMANFFLSEKEEQALGLIRMLNSSGNESAEYLLKKKIPIDKTVQLLKKITALSENNAKKVLSAHLSNKESNELIKLTHSNRDKSYCLIYKEMTDNMIGFYYAKNWNFSKVLDLNNKPQELTKKSLARGTKENIKLMWALSDGPTFIGSEAHQLSQNGCIITFSNSVIFNECLIEARINDLEKRLSGIPKSIFYLKNGELVEKKLQNATVNLSVLFMKNPQGKYSSILAPDSILKSILIRLYYLDAAGLKNFKKIIDENNPLLNTRIVVFEMTQLD